MTDRFRHDDTSAPTDAQRALGARFRASFELFLAATLQQVWSNEHVRGALRRSHVEVESSTGKRVQRDAWHQRAVAVEHVNTWTEGWLESLGTIRIGPDARPGLEHVPAAMRFGVPRLAHLVYRPSLRSGPGHFDVCIHARELTAGLIEIPAPERELYVHRLAAFGDRVVAGIHSTFLFSTRNVRTLRAPRPIDYAELAAMVAPHFVQLDLLAGPGPRSGVNPRDLTH